MGQSDMIVVVSLTFSFMTLMMVVMLLFRHLRDSRYDEKKRMMEIDKLRADFERQIYRLTDRLVASPDRWKDVNHLVLDSQRYDSMTPNLSAHEYLARMGIDPKTVRVDPKKVFVLTPFHDEQRSSFEAIRDVCMSVGLRCVRGDEEFIHGEILPHVLREIAESAIVIANIDGRNPNVFYELGLSHGMGKPSILVSRSHLDAPFDVRAKRIVLYDSYDELRMLLKDELMRFLVEK